MKDKNDLYILLIVGLVAIIGIVIMLSAGSKNSDDMLVDETGLAANTRGKPAAPSCVDGDSGYDYDIKSTVTVNRNKKVTRYTDTCSGNYLVEYACSENSVLSVQYQCPNICNDGACVNPICAIQACAGVIDTGARDSNGCPIYECPVCAVYDMIPGWCENGTIINGLVDNNGCQSAPMCYNDTTPVCATVETCNNIDDDCDGYIDEGLTRYDSCVISSSNYQYTGTQYMICSQGMWMSNTSCIVDEPSLPSLPPVPGSMN